jgi:hypothetical protein
MCYKLIGAIMLTQEILKEYLHYNPDTGIFTWVKSPHKNTHMLGKTAGTLGKKGYVSIGILRNIYKAHKLVWLYMYGYFPQDQIDHINHIRYDNRLSNLREANNTLNQKNTSKRKDNITGVTGVHWQDNRWRVQIGIKGKNKHLGMFLNLEEAIAVRKQAEIDYGFHPNHGN